MEETSEQQGGKPRKRSVPKKKKAKRGRRGGTGLFSSLKTEEDLYSNEKADAMQEEKVLESESLGIAGGARRHKKKRRPCVRKPSKYNLFVKKRMAEMRRSNSSLPITEKMKTIATEWRSKPN